MKFIALLRGINVGGNHKVEMKKLTALLESGGFKNVSTYINSGNIMFEAQGRAEAIRQKLETRFKKEFGVEIPTLIKSEKEMRKIAEAIPKNWENDTKARVDVAYLFPEIDHRKTLDELPMKKEFVDMRYIKGAIFWRVERKNYNKSQLNKIIGHKLYKLMTMRNVNTARYLAGSER